MQCEGLLQLHDALVGFITSKCQVVRYERGQKFDLHEATTQQRTTCSKKVKQGPF